MLLVFLSFRLFTCSTLIHSKLIVFITNIAWCRAKIFLTVVHHLFIKTRQNHKRHFTRAETCRFPAFCSQFDGHKVKFGVHSLGRLRGRSWLQRIWDNAPTGFCWKTSSFDCMAPKIYCLLVVAALTGRILRDLELFPAQYWNLVKMRRFRVGFAARADSGTVQCSVVFEENEDSFYHTKSILVLERPRTKSLTLREHPEVGSKRFVCFCYRFSKATSFCCR